MTDRARCRGLTLLEVLTAVAVFLLGIVGVLGLLTSGTRFHQESQRQAQAVEAVGEVLTRVEAEYGALDLDAARVPRVLPESDGLSYSWMPAPDAPEQASLVLVRIHWLDGGQQEVYEVPHVVRRRDVPWRSSP